MDKILSIQLKYRISKDTTLPIERQVRKRPYILFTLENPAGEVYTKTKKIEHVNLHRDLEGGLAIARLYFKEISDKLALNILNLKEVFPQRSRLTLQAFLAEYLEQRFKEVQRGNLSPGTLRADNNAADRFRNGIGRQTLLSGVTPSSLRDYIDGQLAAGYAKTTINIDLRHMGGAFGQAVKNGLLEMNPFNEIKELKVEKIPRHLWPEEEKILREYFRENNIKHQADYFEFDLATGLRTEEMFNADLNQLRGNRHGEQDLGVIGKGNKFRWVPVDSVMNILEWRRGIIRDMARLKDYLWEIPGIDIQEALRRAAEGKVFFEFGSYFTIPQFINRARTRCKLPPTVRPHSLRHTFAVRFLENNLGDIYDLKEIMGHAHVTTTEIYLSCTPELLRKYRHRVSQLRKNSPY